MVVLRFFFRSLGGPFMSHSTLREAGRDAVPRASSPSETSASPLSTRLDPGPSLPPAKVFAWEKRLVRRLLRALGDPAIAIALYDGVPISTTAAPTATVVFRDRATWLKLLVNPYWEFGEAYSDGRLRIEGDLNQLLAAIYRVQEKLPPPGRLRHAGWRLRNAWESNTLRGSRHHIAHHYDIGNEFYRLWLDREMLYTCAYFPTPEATLEDAQQAKMEHVCRKLGLRPGQTVVEAGCGWGALACYMARHYGVRVRAYNISQAQVAYARRRAAEAGLSEQVEFVQDDYRTIQGRFDAFVSVGMLEHVGTDHYRELGQVVARALSEQGRGLIHSIGQIRPGVPINRWIQRRIFPGAYPPALSEMTELLETAGFGVLDVENLRLHYAKTLEHWLQRFEGSVDTVQRMFDERFVRMWRLYLAGSMASFVGGALHLFQLVFARSGENQIPWTRAQWYAPTESGVD